MASLTTTTTTTTSPTNSLLRRGVRIARSMLQPRCVSNQHINTCEKPAQSTNENLGLMVAAGVVAFVIVIIILVMLHFRRNRREREEFANDHHELSDYGLDEVPATKKGGMGGAGHLQAPAPAQQHRLSAQQLMEAQNPFGVGAELADVDKIPPKKSGSPPPKYPDAVKM
ncbi:hypothetical protein VM1G_07513 [Cytospora mali]|uniref:Uncharacterized protein n=1 Tax=Cytospora mali TaxID=578113 RepID=A0A194W5V4_CYTMA|nr:hypothetical protein VM1G_07513 [Valsa mali]